jgi:hypothetical protein
VIDLAFFLKGSPCLVFGRIENRSGVFPVAVERFATSSLHLANNSVVVFSLSSVKEDREQYIHNKAADLVTTAVPADP